MAGIREVQSGRGQDCCVRSRRRNSTAVLPACGLRRTPVIGVLTFVYPVVAIIIDWAIYGHPIGVAQGVGMVLIAVATLGSAGACRFGGPERLSQARNEKGALEAPLPMSMRSGLRHLAAQTVCPDSGTMALRRRAMEISGRGRLFRLSRRQPILAWRDQRPRHGVHAAPHPATFPRRCRRHGRRAMGHGVSGLLPTPA